MNNFCMFSIPFLYTLSTRLTSKSARFGWLATYLLPTLIFYFFSFGVVNHVMDFILAIVVIYSVYEVGYLYNDAELTKKEINPTLRLSGSNIQFYETNKFICYATKPIISTLIVCYLYFAGSVYFLSAATSACLILFLYLIYNSVRSRLNIPIYSALVFFRYYGAGFLLLSPGLAFYLWLVYPFLMTIEFAAKEKYGISFLIKKIIPDEFRFYSYSIILAAVSILIAFDLIPFNGQFKVFFFLVSYYWFYRAVVFFLCKRA